MLFGGRDFLKHGERHLSLSLRCLIAFLAITACVRIEQFQFDALFVKVRKMMSVKSLSKMCMTC